MTFQWITLVCNAVVYKSIGRDECGWCQVLKDEEPLVHLCSEVWVHAYIYFNRPISLRTCRVSHSLRKRGSNSIHFLSQLSLRTDLYRYSNLCKVHMRLTGITPCQLVSRNQRLRTYCFCTELICRCWDVGSLCRQEKV
jgi:hypothetical protein